MTADQEFERQKVCYEQNFAQARSLNEQMNRVPVLAVTLTGGLWFGAGVTENLLSEIRFGLLLFAGICNIALVLAVLRIRDAMESYLEKIEEFHTASFASGKPKNAKVSKLGSYSMITIYCILMLFGKPAVIYRVICILLARLVSCFAVFRSHRLSYGVYGGLFSRLQKE